MAQTQPTSSSTPSSEAAHLEQLHKMSTTAGVTNRDYVAVNFRAIAAIILGLLSAVSFFSLILLVIPALGLLFGWFALREIRNSSGTQTGRKMALCGIALCVLIAAGAIVMDVIPRVKINRDSEKIAATVSQVAALVKQQKYAQAWDLFDVEFQDRLRQQYFEPRGCPEGVLPLVMLPSYTHNAPLEQFRQQWELVQWEENPASSETRLKGPGKVEYIEWNKVAPVFTSAGGSRAAIAMVRMKFANYLGEDRFQIELREVDGQWRILSFDAIFPRPKPPQPNQRVKNAARDAAEKFTLDDIYRAMR